MAVPKKRMNYIIHVWQCASKTDHRTTQVTPSLHFLFQTGHLSKLCYQISGNSIVQLKKKKDVGIGLLV